MRDSQRLAYLQAMDIPVWLPRSPAPDSDQAVALERIQLGPGSGGTLMICAEQALSASTLASDVARVLPGSPVWAWPSDSNAASAVAESVQEALFTSLVIFGHGLAERLLGKNLPNHLGSARLLVVDDLETLRDNPLSRRRLWRLLCEGRVVTSS